MREVQPRPESLKGTDDRSIHISKARFLVPRMSLYMPCRVQDISCLYVPRQSPPSPSLGLRKEYSRAKCPLTLWGTRNGPPGDKLQDLTLHVASQAAISRVYIWPHRPEKPNSHQSRMRTWIMAFPGPEHGETTGVRKLGFYIERLSRSFQRIKRDNDLFSEIV